MSGRIISAFVRAYKDERGQMLPFMFFLVALIIGAAGLCLDLGHAYACHRELQASTDAAALAGAEAMASSSATTASVESTVSAYSSVPGALNANSNLQETASSITTTFECLNTITALGVACSDSTLDANAIQVVQTASVPTVFIRVLALFGVQAAQSLNIGAVSTAAVKGSASQYNVAIVLDATRSMTDQDSDANCGNTRIYCALQGVQSLLQGLAPCTASSTSTDCTPFDQVSLFVFPNPKANTAQDDTTCNSGNPTNLGYSTPVPGATWTPTNFSSSSATYQITDFLSDYTSNNQQGGAFNSSSDLVIATGGGSGRNCNGIQAIGGESTFYAGAVYAALSSLAAAQAANPGSKNALIVLSDGDAEAGSGNFSATNGYSVGSSGTYPSYRDECHQAITAANYATQYMTQTTVYTVAYGASNSSSSSCETDKAGGEPISACTTLQDMASSPSTFYSDATASEDAGQCVSSVNSGTNALNDIFKNISVSLGGARLIANGTT